jgi:hypothetical protein
MNVTFVPKPNLFANHASHERLNGIRLTATVVTLFLVASATALALGGSPFTLALLRSKHFLNGRLPKWQV